MNFLEELEEYFRNTSREKVLADWEKSSDCDNIGPTVSEFINDNLGVFKLSNENWLEIAKIIDNEYIGDEITTKFRVDKYIGYYYLRHLFI